MDEIKNMFVQVLLIAGAGRLKMVDLNSLFVDGTIIKANANKKYCYKKENLIEYRDKLEKSIKKDLEESIKEDQMLKIQYIIE